MHKMYYHILECAFELISLRPLSDIKVSDIIEKANVSKGSFYRYFKDKFDCISSSYVNNFFKAFEQGDKSLEEAFFVHAKEIQKDKQILKNIAQSDLFLLSFSDINDAYRRYFKKILITKNPTIIENNDTLKAINYFCRTCAITLYLYGNDKISNDEFDFFVSNLSEVMPHCLSGFLK